MSALDASYFERRSFPEPNSGCWLWEGAVSSQGYGRMTFNGKNRNAHRVLWIVTHGEPPDGQLVCHKCDVRVCVNPDHLFLGTNQDNMIDMVRKGRAPAAYPVEVVRSVRQLRGTATHAEIGRRFGLTKTAVKSLLKGTSWRWVS